MGTEIQVLCEDVLILRDDLISKTKWHLSEQTGRDVGAPFTIDYLIKALNLPKEDRTQLIEKYLINPKGDDENAPGKNRLYGEVLRWNAQRQGRSSEETRPLELNRRLIDEYAKFHGLNFPDFVYCTY